MRERAEDIGGKLYVASGAGKGTRVTLHLPTDTLESIQKGVTQ
jgi:signal transduction histidine kinase